MKALTIYSMSIVLALAVAWFGMMPTKVDAASLTSEVGGCCRYHYHTDCPIAQGAGGPCNEAYKYCDNENDPDKFRLERPGCTQDPDCEEVVECTCEPII